MSIFGKLLGRLRAQQVLGMDIGSDGVRLALVRREGDDYHVEWAEEVSLTDMQGFTDYEAVTSKLEPVLKARGVKNIEVAAGPPWNSARVVLEEMPSMSTDRFYKAADWYFQQLDAEALLDPLHHAIPQAPRETAEGAEVIDGLMVSMDAVMVRGLDEMCQKLHLRLGWIAAQPLCYAQILEGSGRSQDDVFVLDVGASQSRLYLALKGHLLLVRKLKPGANDILKDLGEELDLSWTRAAEALLAHSGCGPAADDPELLARTREFIDDRLATLAKQLSDEIQRSGAYARSRHDVDVQTLLISGGLAGSPRFHEELTHRLDLTISPLQPFQNMHGDADVSVESMGHFALAIGSARQHLSAPPEHNILMAGKIRLADAEGTSSRWDTAKRAALIGGAASVVLGVGGLEAMLFQRNQAQQARIGRFQEALDEAHEYAEAFGYNEELFDLDDQIEALRGLYQTRTLHTPYVARVVACLPRDTWLTNLSLQRVELEFEEPAPSHAELLAEDFEDDDEDALIDDILDQAYGDRGDDPPVRTGFELQLAGRTRTPDAVGDLILALESEGLVSRIQTVHVAEEHVDEDAEGSGIPFFRFTLQGQPHLDFNAADRSARGVSR